MRQKVWAGLKEPPGRQWFVVMQAQQPLPGMRKIPDQRAGACPHPADAPGKGADQAERFQLFEASAGSPEGGGGGSSIGKDQPLHLPGHEIPVPLDGEQDLLIPFP